MKGEISLYALEPTGSMTPFVEGVSSPIYRRLDTGALEHSGYGGDAPGVPMMQHGAVFRDSFGTLCIRTPGGDWHPEHRSRTDGAWTIEGTPPKLTIRPSVAFSWPQKAGDGSMVTPAGVRQYHAVLTDGVLQECD